MKFVLKERDKAKEYTVKADDTLESIAQEECEENCDWKLLARYNWGSDRPRDVLHALVETVGVKTAELSKMGSLANPQKIKLDPDSDLKPKLKIPEIWKKEGLGVEKTHTIKVQPIPKAANIIGITELDKWFIPEREDCELEYQLDGPGDHADKVQLDVFGSNYCDCTDWKDGYGKFGDPKALIDEPVFTKDLSSQAEENSSYGMPAGQTWKGQTTTTKGMLGRKTGKEKERYINVAFSPYTVHYRYWKADGDKKARIILDPFWAEFEEEKAEPAVNKTEEANQVKMTWTNAKKVDYGLLEVTDATKQRVYVKVLEGDKLAKGAKEEIWNKNYAPYALNGKFEAKFIDDHAEATPLTRSLFKSHPYTYKVTTMTYKPKSDSLKVKGEIKDTTKLERGQVRITDGNGKLVYHKALPKGKLGKGKQTFVEWDGKYGADIKNSKDGDKAIPEDMPYRVQIQAHTGMDKPEGVAISVMHTEVRLHVDKDNVRPSDIRFDSWTAKNSLSLGLGPLAPGTPPKKRAGRKWYQYKLAEYGFHPGPMDGKKNDAYKIALKEFKRSIPRKGNASAGNFKRMLVDENENRMTKTAISKIRNNDKRKWFGSLTRVNANNNNPDLTDNQIKRRLPNPSRDVIIWVDDRQYYTQTRSAKNENNKDFTSGNATRRAFGLYNYRGAMESKDGRTDTDGTSIPRPWIPLEVSMPLASRSQGLYGNLAAATDDERKKDRRAVGPLRVDWTFEELPYDISTINPASYSHDYMRVRKYVAWAIMGNAAEHTRKDTKRKVKYTNCPKDRGGIRDNLANYYKDAFGHGDDDSLMPWKAAPESSTESVATVVHDHIAASQKKEKSHLYKDRMGTAGVYFRPSIIAGDGYRVRAEVQFDKFGGYDFPNAKALKARYPVPPQAHTARLRMWRRSSIRGYLCWSSAASGHWPGFVNGFRTHYRAGHVYFVHEGGRTPNAFNVADVFNPAKRSHRNRFKNIVRNNVRHAELKNKNKMTLKSNFIWAWDDQDDYGYPLLSDEGLTNANVYTQYVYNQIMERTWGFYSEALLYAILKQIEKQGYLRGHLMAEFLSSGPCHIKQYECNRHSGAKHRYWALEKGSHTRPARLGTNTRCPAAGCFRDPAGASPRRRSTLRARPGAYIDYASMPLWAEGNALGATWLFTSSDAETWVHEVGHHRHFEHAANAPGAEYATQSPEANARLHDNEDNNIPDWVALGVATASQQDWDRRCIMSYTEDGHQYFCGKCILRNRGWKIQTLGLPGVDVREP